MIYEPPLPRIWIDVESSILPCPPLTIVTFLTMIIVSEEGRKSCCWEIVVDKHNFQTVITIVVPMILIRFRHSLELSRSTIESFQLDLRGRENYLLINELNGVFQLKHNDFPSCYS